MSAIKLLPCPFCGSTNIDPEGWASTTLKGPACDDCSGSAETVEQWNKRPEVDRLRTAIFNTINDLNKKKPNIKAMRDYLASVYNAHRTHQRPEVDRLRAALKPFAEVGKKIAHAVGPDRAFPPGTSVRFLKLEPLKAQHLVDAATALEEEHTNSRDGLGGESR